jgi:cytochrome c oxidase subunit 4
MASHSDNHGGHSGASGGHVMPVYMLAFTFAVLLVLTILTVTVTQVDLGSSLNLSIAMIIATIKAAMVCLYFMHLRFDKPFNALILVSCIGFVILFLGLSTLDTESYSDDIRWEQVDIPGMKGSG